MRRGEQQPGHSTQPRCHGQNRALKPGGRAFLHTTNLKAPDGWKRFSRQEAYRVEGHYFIVPEVVETLADHGNFEIIKRSSPDASNSYLNRDFLVVLEKKGPLANS